MIKIIKHPFKWLSDQFPELDFKSVTVMLTGSVVLILFLYHGKPFHFAKHLPEFNKSLSPVNRKLASYIYSHLFAMLVLMLIPLGIIKFVFKEKISDWGIRFKGSGKEFKTVVIMYLFFLPIIIFMSRTASFQATYPKLKLIKTGAFLFIMYQAFYLLKWIAWEFFFRGFLLFGFKEKYGEGAVLFSTMPFVIVHLGKPQGEIFGAIAAGFILCRLSLNGKSVFPGVWLHFMVAGTMDFVTSTWWH